METVSLSKEIHNGEKSRTSASTAGGRGGGYLAKTIVQESWPCKVRKGVLLRCRAPVWPPLLGRCWLKCTASKHNTGVRLLNLCPALLIIGCVILGTSLTLSDLISPYVKLVRCKPFRICDHESIFGDLICHCCSREAEKRHQEGGGTRREEPNILSVATRRREQLTRSLNKPREGSREG